MMTERLRELTIRGQALKIVLALACLLALIAPALSQRRRGGGLDGFGGFGGPPRMPESRVPRGDNPHGEYTFARAIYHSPYSPYNTWRGGSWTVDFPEADEHFVIGIREWVGTNLNISSDPVQLRFTDERIFDFPLIYIVEPGFMELSDEEAANIREYLLRGGFLFLDDFHGEYEWEHVQEQMKKVLPEYEIKDLPPKHPLFHSYLDINEVVQVPGIHSWVYRGVTYEKGGVTPHYMGIEDKNGKLMVFMTRNSDFGDAWEWINDPRYPVRFGLAAYRVGINVIIYAMTH